ncbi:recombinase RecT, partial [Propionibacterium freudenreichii]|uniref:recombinase RecT n=1 Tax=Propionibacterium freudenreichii TaxID=1744 RepID=UPI0038536FFC
EVLDRADVSARRARSQASESGPWKTDEAAMWRKTAVRAASWQMPQSAEMQRVEALNQVEDGRAGLSDALDSRVLEM